MIYQIDYGHGWQQAYPDGYGLHQADCQDPECTTGCWSPESGDPDMWLEALADEGVAVRARVVCGGDVLGERTYLEERGPERMDHDNPQRSSDDTRKNRPKSLKPQEPKTVCFICQAIVPVFRLDDHLADAHGCYTR